MQEVLNLQPKLEKHTQDILDKLKTITDVSEDYKEELKKLNLELEELTNVKDSLSKYLDLVADGLDITPKMYFTKETYDKYFKPKNYEFLVEEGLTLAQFMNWFYSELPIVKNNAFVFTGLNTQAPYQVNELDYQAKVFFNREDRFVYAQTDLEPVFIGLKNVDLFDVISVAVDSEETKYIEDLFNGADVYGGY